VDLVIEDVRELIEKLGGRATVVGHDWGGIVAWILVHFSSKFFEKKIKIYFKFFFLILRTLIFENKIFFYPSNVINIIFIIIYFVFFGKILFIIIYPFFS
jgi:hypothetical protein